MEAECCNPCGLRRRRTCHKNDVCNARTPYRVAPFRVAPSIRTRHHLGRGTRDRRRKLIARVGEGDSSVRASTSAMRDPVRAGSPPCDRAAQRTPSRDIRLGLAFGQEPRATVARAPPAVRRRAERDRRPPPRVGPGPPSPSTSRRTTLGPTSEPRPARPARTAPSPSFLSRNEDWIEPLYGRALPERDCRVRRHTPRHRQNANEECASRLADVLKESCRVTHPSFET